MNMIDLLCDNEGQPLEINHMDRQKIWNDFYFDSCSESCLVNLLQNSILEKFEDIDSRLSDLSQICIFSHETFEYLEELFPGSRYFNRDYSENLVIFRYGILGIISLKIFDGKLNFICASCDENDEMAKSNLVSEIVNYILHWLWLSLNSY